VAQIDGERVNAHKPLQIGPITVNPPVVLAPMAGITNAPFRRLCRQYGAGLYVSEMITARGLVERNEKTMKMARFADDEPVRSIQLYGTHPRVLGEAVRMLVDDGHVDHIDMNFGCPVAKVTRKGGGAALPIRRALFADVVRAAVGAAGAVPVTVKLRMGVDDAHLTYLDAGRAAEDAGAASVALHARTAAQHYSGQADWAAIATLKETVTSIPVLGNGDIWSGDDALAMIAQTGCDGVVVGRGCLGRPWLFRELAAAFAGQPMPPPPNLGEVAIAMRRHATLLAEWNGESSALRDFRKHVGWYLTGYPAGREVRRRLTLVSSLAELDDALATLDGDLELPDRHRAMPRGKSSGPFTVTLPDRWVERADDPTPSEAEDIEELEAVSGG
jgi:nifR3 family TIM-barrel protein